MGTAIDEIDEDLKRARGLEQTHRLAWQFGVKRLRLWVWDEKNNRSVRPYIMMVMELYPRGAVITSQLSSPVGVYPSPLDALRMIVGQMLNPSDDEKTQRPTQVSFVDEMLFEFCRRPLASCGIEVAHLTLADGVDDYVKQFSDKLVERGHASRGDSAERPGMRLMRGIDDTMMAEYFDVTKQFKKAAPWRSVEEECAIEATWLNGGETRYVTILGSSDRTYGIAVMESMTALKRKYARAVGTYDVEKDIRARLMCAMCGKEPSGSETFRCAKCKQVFYCDEVCQRGDWRQHRTECGDEVNLDHITRAVWQKREQAVILLDPTAVPFDDLDYGEEKKLWDREEEGTFPLAFVSIPSNYPGLPPRVERPSRAELEWMIQLLRTVCQSNGLADEAVELNGLKLEIKARLDELTEQVLVVILCEVGMRVATDRGLAGHLPTRLLGLGSITVDYLLRLDAYPKLGEKCLMRSPLGAAKKQAGGVMLNHISWAAALGVPSGILGRLKPERTLAEDVIRSEIKARGIDDRLVQYSPMFKIPESLVMLVGEEAVARDRTIFMYRGDTANIAVDDCSFEKIGSDVSLLSTEVSQIRLEIVLSFLRTGRRIGAMTLLDLDMPMSVACFGENKLGTEKEFMDVLRSSDVIKATRQSAVELLGEEEPCVELQKLTGAELVVLTDGSRGSEFYRKDDTQGRPESSSAVFVPSVSLSAGAASSSEGNTLGAGDAFFGGLLAGIYAENSRLPTDWSKLEQIVRQAVVCGALCCSLQETLPPHGDEFSGWAKAHLHARDLRILQDACDAILRVRSAV